MDQLRFEILARSVARVAERAATDRRTALRLLLGGAAAALFGRLGRP